MPGGTDSYMVWQGVPLWLCWKVVWTKPIESSSFVPCNAVVVVGVRRRRVGRQGVVIPADAQLPAVLVVALSACVQRVRARRQNLGAQQVIAAGDRRRQGEVAGPCLGRPDVRRAIRHSASADAGSRPRLILGGPLGHAGAVQLELRRVVVAERLLVAAQRSRVAVHLRREQVQVHRLRRRPSTRNGDLAGSGTPLRRPRPSTCTSRRCPSPTRARSSGRRSSRQAAPRPRTRAPGTRMRTRSRAARVGAGTSGPEGVDPRLRYRVQSPLACIGRFRTFR